MKKSEILEKLWQRLPGSPTNIDIDSDVRAVRFDYRGLRFRVDEHAMVEVVEGGILKSCVTAELLQTLLRV